MDQTETSFMQRSLVSTDWQTESDLHANLAHAAIASRGGSFTPVMKATASDIV